MKGLNEMSKTKIKKRLIKPMKKQKNMHKITLFVSNENCQCCTVNMSKC